MEWIKTSEQLPGNSEVLLVRLGNKFGPFEIAIGAYYEGKWRIVYDTNEEAGYFYSEYVTHWMPLPEPPNQTT